MRLIRTDRSNKDFIELVAALDRELTQRYRQEQATFDPYNVLDDSAHVVLAYNNDIPVGCGCWRPMEETEPVAEIKRMYVAPGYRGRGIAGFILKELETWIREVSYASIKLETGSRQPEAVSLYLKKGYCQIENYGPYQRIPESICLGKELTRWYQLE